MDRLIVKNFGPLKDVDIELNKINLFIGENGSGKSVLAKLVTILLDTLFSDNKNREKEIFQKLEEYNIDFVNEETSIEYLFNKEKILSLQKKHIQFNINKEKVKDSLLVQLNEMKTSFGEDYIKNVFNQQLKKIADEQGISFDNIKSSIKEEELLNIMESNISNQLDILTNEKLLYFTAQYIPAERNLISLFNKYVTTFITADIPLPKFLLNFSSQYTRAREDIQQLKFLNVEYKLKNGQEHIFYTEEEFLLLEHSSSGIQSAFPLYLTVKYFAKKHRSIIIEEPEQNLFPKAQRETVEYIVEQISDENRLFMMTHSPYVLSTLNILMMAYKAGNLNEESKKEVSEFFNEKQWINPDDFSAYYLEDGVARDITGRTGLISENNIDDISDTIQEDFEELLAIYREHKNDK